MPQPPLIACPASCRCLPPVSSPQALMCMICLMRELIESRIVALVLASALTSWGMSVYRPLLAIAVKWVVVGRFRPGRYPLWGSYYLRWWLADQFRRAGGLGAFGKTPALIRTYYRLMGARIGARVIIDPSAVLGEFDLLELGDDALVDAQVRRSPPELAACCEAHPPRLAGSQYVGMLRPRAGGIVCS